MVERQRFGPATEERLTDVRAFPEQYQRAVADRMDEELFEGHSAAIDRDYVGVGRRLDAVPWTVFLMLPRGEINRPVFDLFLKVALWCLPVVLLGLAAGILMTVRILRPIRALSQVLRRFGTGDLASRVPVHSRDELGELAAGFNSMAEQLSRNMRALNEREARIRSIVDSAADGLVTINEHGV